MKKTYQKFNTTCLLICSFIMFFGCENPTKLSIIDTGMTSVALSWEPLTVDNGLLSYYNVYLSTDGGSNYSVCVTTSDTAVTLECLYPDTDYDIKIKAMDNNTNESEDSVVGSATTLPNDGTVYEEDVSADDIPSLSGITTILGGICTDYSTLTDFSGLESLTTICEDLYIGYNDALTSLSGLHNLTSVGEELEIYYNDALTSLSGLDNLISVGGNLSISDNAALTSLFELNNVTSVGRNLFIKNNDALTVLSALYNVVLSGDKLTIEENDVLPIANAWALDTQLRDNGFIGTTTIDNNGP